MNNLLKHIVLSISVLSLAVSLTACGGGSSSPNTVPNTATVFYAHNLVFNNSSTLMAAGYNAFGQLGTGNLANQAKPVAVSGGTRFSGFATGGNHSVAFINNSTVRSWGYNGFGQLGNGSTTYSSKPVSTFSSFSTSAGKKIASLSNVTAVAAGATHTLALKSDGTVWAWGDNARGQLGNFATSTPLGYSKIALQVAGGTLTNIDAIAAGGDHSLSLDKFGNVWAWGENSTGQLGIDPNTTSALVTPRIVTGFPTTIVAIAAGGGFNYALTSAGEVWAWGNNSNGQLGDGTTVNSFTPVRVMKADGTPLSTVVQISAGIQHGLARLDDGSVWSLGYNIFGQLGINTKNDSSVAVQVQVLDTTGTAPFAGATDIRAFGSSSMARNGSGWFVWGDNAYGQLGTGGTGSLLLPVKSGF